MELLENVSLEIKYLIILYSGGISFPSTLKFAIVKFIVLLLLLECNLLFSQVAFATKPDSIYCFSVIDSTSFSSYKLEFDEQRNNLVIRSYKSNSKYPTIQRNTFNKNNDIVSSYYLSVDFFNSSKYIIYRKDSFYYSLGRLDSIVSLDEFGSNTFYDVKREQFYYSLSNILDSTITLYSSLIRNFDEKKEFRYPFSNVMQEYLYRRIHSKNSWVLSLKTTQTYNQKKLIVSSYSDIYNETGVIDYSYRDTFLYDMDNLLMKSSHFTSEFNSWKLDSECMYLYNRPSNTSVSEKKLEMFYLSNSLIYASNEVNSDITFYSMDGKVINRIYGYNFSNPLDCTDYIGYYPAIVEIIAQKKKYFIKYF